MKRIPALLLIFAFILSLSSCIAKPTDIPTVESKSEEIIANKIEDIPVKEPLKVGVFWYDLTDTFNSAVRDSLNAELDKLGVEYENFDASFSPETQINQVDEAIENGTNLLIVNIAYAYDRDNYIDPNEHPQALCDKAKVADIPIIFFDRWVDDTVRNTHDKTFQIIYDSEATAITKLAEAAADYVVDNYDDIDLNKDGKITFITFRSTIMCNCQKYEAFQLACNEAFAKIGKPELVYHDPQNTEAFEYAYEWSRSATFERMEEVLSERPMDGDDPIEIVFANSDDMALSAIEALDNVGWNTGDSSSIPVFGFSSSIIPCEAIEEGRMNGSTIRSCEGMSKAIIELINNLMDENNNSDNIENNQTIYVPYEIII